MIAFADVEHFAQICGDGICQANENRGVCPQDCKSGVRDSYCDREADSVCDADCADNNDPDCSSSSGTWVVCVAGGCVCCRRALIIRRIYARHHKTGEGDANA